MKIEFEKKEELKNQLKVKFEKLKGGNRRQVLVLKLIMPI